MLMTVRLPARVQDVVVLHPYRWIAAVVFSVTGLLWILQQHIDGANIALFYLIAVLLCAVTARRVPVVIGAVICFLSFKFFFVEPIFGFSINDIAKPWELLSFIAAGLISGALAWHAHEQAAVVRQQAREIALLSSTNQPSARAQPAGLTYFDDGEFTIFLDDEDSARLMALFEQGRLVEQQDPAWELHDALSEFVGHWLSVQARSQ